MKYDINQVLSEAYESEVSKPTAELNSRVIRQAQVKGRSSKTVKYIRTKLAAAIAVGCCIIGILVGPSVHALAETIFSEWKTTLKFEDGTESIISSDSIFKKIPESAILDDDGGANTTIGKAQEALGLDLLEHKNVASDEVFYCMELNEDGTPLLNQAGLPELDENKLIASSIKISTKGECGYEKGLPHFLCRPCHRDR